MESQNEDKQRVGGSYYIDNWTETFGLIKRQNDAILEFRILKRLEIAWAQFDEDCHHLQLNVKWVPLLKLTLGNITSLMHFTGTDSFCFTIAEDMLALQNQHALSKPKKMSLEIQKNSQVPKNSDASFNVKQYIFQLLMIR